MSDSGTITFDYFLDVGGNPESLCFSPNGYWGLIGSHTTTYPPTQRVTIIRINKNMDISVSGYLFNDQENLVSISPDSLYGVYGFDLKTIRYYSDGTFKAIPNQNPPLAAFDAPFSSYNGRMISQNGRGIIIESTLLDDGRTTTTGFILDINPDFPNADIAISPDGKTCVLIGVGPHHVISLRIHKEGGFHIAQMLVPPYGEPMQVDFTPDSKYAIISYWSDYHNPGLVSYSIGDDSTLTEVDAEYIPPTGAGEDMAVTPDGKYAVTRTISAQSGYSDFYVVSIYPDGKMQYLPDKTYRTSGDVSAIAFVPPQKTEADSSWAMYH